MMVHRNRACAYMKRSQVPVGPPGYGGPVKITNATALGRIRDRAEPIARNPKPFSSERENALFSSFISPFRGESKVG